MEHAPVRRLSAPWIASGLVFLLGLGGFLAMVSPLVAQQETGALHGVATIDTGDLLPGVAIELTGIGAPRLQVTDSQGLFRFLGLDPGSYSLKATLDGFAAVRFPEITIQIDRSTELRIRLSPAVTETITVDAESPLLDERKVSPGTHIARKELQAIPTARDPWAILNQAPGVLTDQVDVGGTRATQAVVSAFGTSRDENDYLLDGVQITDMAVNGGGSSTYFDFDQFEEIQVATGGTDISKNTAGVSLNLVTRRGNNQPRGSARLLRTDNSWQSEPKVDANAFAPNQEEVPTNALESLDDYGIELGGPVVKDRLWLWGSFGRYDIVELPLGGTPQKTQVEGFAAKANAQLSDSNSAVILWNETDKLVFDRGAGIDRAPETLLQQTGPTPILKIEDSHIFGNNLMLIATYSHVGGGFQAIPNGGVGPDAPEPLTDSDGVLKNNYYSLEADRPAAELRLSLSWFLAAGRSSHELTFGARRRDYSSSGGFLLPGRQLWHFAGENFGEAPGPIDFVYAERATAAPIELQYTSAWVQDTMRLGNWTFHLGARYDLQKGENLPTTVEANAGFPELLPALEFEGNDGGFDWSTVSPRLGVTYAIGADRETLIRASFARFVDALSTSDISRVNPVGTAYAYFAFVDGNDNNIWDNRQLDGEPVFLFGDGFDPSDPTATSSPNVTDSGLEPGITDELILGTEHAIRPELVIGLTATWRKSSNGLVERSLVRESSGSSGTVRVATRNDYNYERTLTTTLPDGSEASVDFYALSPGLSFNGGSLLTNGAGESEYRGLAVTARKRYTNDWALRGYINWGDAELDLPASETFFDDPTRTGFDVDGDLALQAGWSFNINGLVSIARERLWGFDVSANLYGREGYPLAYFLSSRSRLDGLRRNAWVVHERDDFRLPELVTLDLGLQKSLPLSRDLRLTASADLFNVFNDSTALDRQTQLNHPQADYLLSTLSPRIWRFGLRLSWR